MSVRLVGQCGRRERQRPRATAGLRFSGARKGILGSFSLTFNCGGNFFRASDWWGGCPHPAHKALPASSSPTVRLGATVAKAWFPEPVRGQGGGWKAALVWASGHLGS